MGLLRRGVSLAVVLSCLTVAACGGGGGSSSGGGTGGGLPPLVTPIPVPTATSPPFVPSSSTQSLNAGNAPSSASFGTISNGLTGTTGLAASTSGSATVTAVLSAGLPAGAPALSSMGRVPRAISASGIAGLTYVTFTSNASVSFPSTPSFTFTAVAPTLLMAPTPGYIAFYDSSAPANGWTTILGPVTIGGTSATWTFPAATLPVAFAPNAQYVYALFTAASAVATPSPTPSATPVATITPSPSPSPASSASPHPPTPTPSPTPTAAPTIPPAPAAGPLAALRIDSFQAIFGGVLSRNSSTVILTGVGTNRQYSDGTAVTTAGGFSVSLSGPTLQGSQRPLSRRSADVHRYTDIQGLHTEWQPRTGKLISERLRRSLQIVRRPGAATRQTRALPTSVGATASLWAQNAAIGASNGTYTPVPATLAAVTAHGYIWLDSTLTSVLSDATTIQQIGADFENAYSSDTAHFGTTVYDPTVYAAAKLCDPTGITVGTGSPFANSDARTVVFVVNPQSLGGGVGGYFDEVNFFTQGFLNCDAAARAAHLHSNEAPMVYLGWFGPGTTLSNPSPLSYVLSEDLVRSSAHELQHLINFVDHNVLTGSSTEEDTFINEGLSMLAQDFAVQRKYGLKNDVSDAMRHANEFLTAPQNFSLTGFSGIDTDYNKTTPQYNCSGCYGASYLFQRYLYDRLGGDAYLAKVEATSAVGLRNIANIAAEQPDAVLLDFGVALAVQSSQASSTDPRYRFPGFPFWNVVQSQTGASVQALPPASAGSGPVGGSFTPAPYDGGYVFWTLLGGGLPIVVTDTGLPGFEAGLSQR